jgi:hypothetical protein
MSRSRFASSLVFALAVALTACSEDNAITYAQPTGGLPDGGGGAGGGEGGAGGEGGMLPPACGSANRALPEDAVTVAWDDDVASTYIGEQTFEITVNGKAYALAEESLWEAVRFDLDHPAKVVGFSVQWAPLPEGTDPKRELSAAIYGDFGYNGFDFWAPEPLYAGTRCAEDVKPGEWLDYVLEEPIEVTHPGLVYVAARREDASSPGLMFDGTVSNAGDCALWDDCHSAMNLPEKQLNNFYNGISFPFQYDYMVRLHVVYTDDVAPEERFFQPAATLASAHGSFGDYDNDGDDDLLLSGPILQQNQGDGTFVDVSATSGLSAMGLSTTGGVFGDYDNDGCLDLFLYAEAYTLPDALVRSNCDGTFSDATPTSGIVDMQSYEACDDAVNNVRSPTAAAAWLDIDADGLLDLYLANFICWAKYTYYVDSVYRNNGDGTFTDWTSQNGFSTLETASRGAAPIDSDGDGDIDLFVNNYVLQANLYFENQGDGTVVEKAAAVGVAGVDDKVGTQHYFGHTIGAAWGDLDNDGDFDLVAANLAHPRFFDFSDKTQVLLQDGATHMFTDNTGTWEKPVSAAGLRYQETHSVPGLADFDQDGALDLVITAVYPGRPTDFYWGQGDGTFTLDAYHAGITTENGWGVAIADVDSDGDPDLFANDLFKNELSAAEKGHFVEVRAFGNAGSNWAAIGATVRVSAGGKTLLRHVQGGTGKGGQDSLYLHYGLGTASSVDSIAVMFPGGKEVVYAGPFAADQRYWVYEDGTVKSGFGWHGP